MATERKAPDVLLIQTNLSGAVTDIDEDPDSPGSDWLTYVSNNANTVCRVSFPTPTGNPNEGADLQEFKIGDKVALKADSGVQKGMYFPRFHGKAGVVKGKKGKCYEVMIKDIGKEKTLIVHPVHLRRL